VPNPDSTASNARIHYGLVIGCGVAVEIMQALFLVHAFGFYASEWIREFGWSNTAVALAFSIYRGGTGLLAPIQGALLDRVGARKSMLGGILAFGCGYAALSQVNSLATLYLVFSLLAVGGSLSGPTAVMTVLVNWFARKQAAVIAIAQMGFGLSSLVVPLMALAIASWGWRITSLVSGLSILAVGLSVCFVIRNRPEDRGLKRYGSEIAEAPPERGDGAARSSALQQRRFQSVGEVLRIPAFWLLAGGHSVTLIFISSVTVHLVSFLTGDLRLDEQHAAWVVLVIGISMAVGQLVLTFVESYFLRKELLAGGLLAIHAGALAMLAIVGSFNQVLLVSFVYGFVWGARGPLQHTLRADYFGTALFGRLSGVALTISMAGMVVGPVFGGVLADLLGSHRLGFLVLSGVALVAAAMFASAKRPPGIPASSV
jgi:MFS family permease